jgi:hypothetical protein
MKKYGVLDDNGIVINIIVAASLQIAESVSSSDCVLIPQGTFVDMGYLYSDGVFSNPAEETTTEETPA